MGRNDDFRVFFDEFTARKSPEKKSLAPMATARLTAVPATLESILRL
jgi:hypothetical protein